MKYIFQFFILLASFQLAAQNGLVNFLSFDNNDLIEESGNGQNGVTTNSPIFVCGVKGQALHFNGTSDILTIFGMGNVLDANDFTISFYIKPEATLTTQTVLSKRDLCNNKYALGAHYFPNSNGLDYLLSENSSKSLLFREFLNEDRCWHHLVLVRENANLKLYINGILKKEDTSVTRIDIANDSELLFGGGPCAAPNVTPFKGALDEVMIFNRALNQSAVEELYLHPNEVLTNTNTPISLGTAIDIQSNNACATTFFWSPTDGIDNPTSSSPIITPTETTVYTLEFDMGNCTATDSVRVIVFDPDDLGCDNILLPSAFTPNDDGLNDTYGISNYYAIEELVSFEIFDQWGGRVFYTTDPQGRWLGYNEKIVVRDGDEEITRVDIFNPNVYLYRVHYRCQGELNTQTGSVTILR